MNKNFDFWNKIKKQTDTTESKAMIRSGEIRWCKFGINIGNEILGKGETFKRPVLILKKFSRDVFLGLPLTKKKSLGTWYYPISNNKVSGSVILNQSRTLDRKRLEEKITQVRDEELVKIKEAFCKLVLTP